MIASLLFAVTLVLNGAAQEKAIGLKAIEFTLRDQYNKEWRWENHWKGKPVVMVMSDWKGSDYVSSWTEPLAATFKDKMQFVAMADVSLAPGFVHSLIRSKFREAYTNSILLDWEGTVFKYYRVKEGVPNVLFISADGTVMLHTWGKGSPNHVNKFASELEKYL